MKESNKLIEIKLILNLKEMKVNVKNVEIQTIQTQLNPIEIKRQKE